jgi:organic radical activating enzyme
MKIHNVRLGLAMNSSSTHSLIFLDELVNGGRGLDKDVYDREFGWNFFTAASKEAKKDYVALTVYSNLARIYPNDIAFAVAKELFGYDLRLDEYGVSGYIDHQSVIALPRSWDEKSLNKEFIEDFQKYILQEKLVILGGNDNDESEHPLLAKGVDASQNMPLDGNRGLVARKDDSGYWTLFNRNTGAKIRFSFERDAETPTKASAPELVDVKITDKCPFNCEYCYMDSTLQGKHAPMQELEKVIGQLSSMKVFEVALGGGEPTLHPEFMEILRRFHTANIIVNFTTKSLAWLKDPKQWALIRKYAGGFAYSVEKSTEIDECVALLINNGLIQNVEPYYYRDTRFQASAQHVVGTAYEGAFELLLEKAYHHRHNLRLTLLGFKEDGRGHTVKPHISADKALEILKKFVGKNPYFQIGIDTLLAKQWDEQLQAAGIHKTFYHTQEGKFSMYVDAVEGKCAPASYGDMSKAVTYASKYNIWRSDQPMIKVDRQGPNLQEAFKAF